MADENDNITLGPDGLPVVTVTGTRKYDYNDLDEFYDINKISNHNLLRSCKFAFMLLRHPNILNDRSVADLREFTFLCDSIELPGRTVSTLDYLIPGQQKIKTPFKREYNEITLSFYHNTKLGIYDYFNDWVDNMSYTSTNNQYFDNIVTDLRLIQFNDVEAFNGKHKSHLNVRLYSAFPISVASLPCNWADDGYHKLSVTMFYEVAFGSNRARVEQQIQIDDADLRDQMDQYAKQQLQKTLEDLPPPQYNFGD